MKHPTGKGMCIWQIKRIRNGDPEAIADSAVENGFSWIVMKVLGGMYKYNLRLTSNNRWVDDLLPPVIDHLHARGIEVYGYQYIYLDNGGTPEAQAAVSRVMALGLDGFVIDAESEVYNRHEDASKYAEHIRGELPGLPVGLASFRYPDLHRPVPWDELLSCSTFHMPQVYWLKSDNPDEQLLESHRQLMKLAELPFVPIGCAYDEHGFKPTKYQIDIFNATAHVMNFPAINWWEWFEAEQNGFMDTIKAHKWEDDIEPPPPPPPDPRVCTHEIADRDGDWIKVRSEYWLNTVDGTKAYFPII